jgi:phospholipase/lecithinase/hemolysin
MRRFGTTGVPFDIHHFFLAIVLIFAANQYALADQVVQRLACQFYDTTNPHEGAGSLATELPSVGAKGLSDEDIYITGTISGGFFDVSSIRGMSRGMISMYRLATYENSYALARAFCLRGLIAAFPDTYENKVLMQMKAKPAFLSMHGFPLVFKHRYRSLINQIDRLVIFGDSLSDQGNLKLWLRIFPKPPYFGGRFSNLENWVDYLQRMTGLAVQNWAVGGSVSSLLFDLEANNTSIPQKVKTTTRSFVAGSVKKEIGRFAKKSLENGVVSNADSTLFSVWIGGNDYISLAEKDVDADIFLDYPDDKRVGSNIVLHRVVNNIINNVRKLYQLGARNVVVTNLPDLGSVPRILENSAYHKRIYESKTRKIFTLSQKMTDISVAHNNLLKTELGNLNKKLPRLNLILVDAAQSFNYALRSIDLYDGISHFNYDFVSNFRIDLSIDNRQVSINKACYLGGGLVPDTSKICATPEKVLFWDDIHPTNYGHCLIATAFHQALAQAQILRPSSLADYMGLCRPELVN